MLALKAILPQTLTLRASSRLFGTRKTLSADAAIASLVLSDFYASELMNENEIMSVDDKLVMI
jgi:hypothetical protein